MDIIKKIQKFTVEKKILKLNEEINKHTKYFSVENQKIIEEIKNKKHDLIKEYKKYE